MILKRKFILFLFSSFVITTQSGCAVWKYFFPEKKVKVETVHFPEDKILEMELKEKYEEGLFWLGRKDYERAIKTFEGIQRKYPTSKYTQDVHYNTAVAYEKMMIWSEALKEYRKVVAHSSSPDSIRTNALYRLSFVYEELGEDVNSVASLHDAVERKHLLPSSVARAEAPARLAAGYARLGNIDLANQYFSVAEKGIRDLQKTADIEKPPEWVAKTLFYMGHMSAGSLSGKKFEDAIRPLERAQSFLVQAAEMPYPKWSEKAASLLVEVYDRLWTVILDEEIPDMADKTLALRKRQQMQKEKAMLYEEVLRALKAMPLPDTPPAPSMSKIFSYIGAQEKKVEDFLLADEVGSGLTPEGKARESLKRPGRSKLDIQRPN